MMGYLHYDARQDRFLFCPSGNSRIISLHCGDGVEVFDNGAWMHLTMEGADGKNHKTVWYLTDGYKTLLRDLEGRAARMDY